MKLAIGSFFHIFSAPFAYSAVEIGLVCFEASLYRHLPSYLDIHQTTTFMTM